MSVDVFGRSLIGPREVQQGPPGVGFSLTEDGDFDIENHRLCNVASAVKLTDAANLKDLELLKKDLKKDIKKLTDNLLFLQKNFVEIVKKITFNPAPKAINLTNILSPLK